MRFLIAIILMFLSLMGASCDQKTEGVMSDKELRTFVESQLKIGDSKEKVEQFFEDQNWHYYLEDPTNIFPNKDDPVYGHVPEYRCHYKLGAVNTWYEKSSVAILVYVDDAGQLVRSEVRRSYTGGLF